MRIPVYILKNYFSILIGILFFIVASFFFQLNLFGADLYEDGFFSQINFIANGDGGLEGLGYNHYARFISVYPFFLIWLGKMPNYYNAVAIAFILLPILSYKANTKDFRYLQLLILLLPFFFSIRITLGASCFGYLYVYLFSAKKKLILLLFSLLFSMLSSGTFICYFLILFYHRKTFSRVNPILFKILSIVVFISIIVAVQNKYEGVSGGADGYSDEGESYTGIYSIWGLLIRGTLIESIRKAQYLRAISYTGLYLISISLIGLIVSHKGVKAKYFYFFVPMLIIFWFEGMGYISYIYCLILFPLYNINYRLDSENNNFQVVCKQ